MTTEYFVVKRDGRTVAWDPSRVLRAVSLAFYAQQHQGADNPHRGDARARYGLDPQTAALAEMVTAEVVQDLLPRLEAGETPTVEEIGDITERQLAEAGHWAVARAYVIYRSRHGELRLARHGDSGLSDYIAVSKYARFRPELGRRELWTEAVDRVEAMHQNRFALRGEREWNRDGLRAEGLLTNNIAQFVDTGRTLAGDITWAFDGVRGKRWLPSMRSLQFGGDAIAVNEARIFNCSFTHIDRLRAFSESMYLLLSGTGVGFSVQRHHVAKLPVFPVRGSEDDLPVEHYTIADTIEGWSDALHALLLSYVEGRKIEFSYAEIRAKGSPLRTSGGRAPGHLPLKRALTKIEQVLDGVSGRRLKPIEAYDILMHGARAVLSGGIRRSATIALFSPDDMEMASAKTGNWLETQPQRAGSNNSAVLVRSTATEAEFHGLFEAQKEYGEPGFYFTESTEYGANPCVTADTWVTTSEGPRQVRDLVGRGFEAIVDGKAWRTTDRGFFATGTKQVFRVETARGYTVRATANHQILVSAPAGSAEPTVWKRVDELAPGDEIVVHDHRGLQWGAVDGEEQSRGYLLGSLLGDGTLMGDGTALLDFWGPERHGMRDMVASMVRETVGVAAQGAERFGRGDTPAHDRCRVGSAGVGRLAGSYGMAAGAKQVTPQIEGEGASFTAGFLQGWFDADGSVQGTQEKGVSVRLTSISGENLEAAQRMLARLGIAATIYRNRREAGERMMPDGRGGEALYPCQAVHELIISGANLAVFGERVGFRDPAKAGLLAERLAGYRRAMNRETWRSAVTAIVADGVEEVFDCTVPGPHAFDANGLYVHNCVEIGLAPTVTVMDREINRLRELGYTGAVKQGDVLSGWQMCNLSTINGGACRTAEDFYRACAAATLIGTLQASYTNIPYLGPISQLINERESLLGVSITGILDHPELLLDPQVLETGAQVVKAMNARVAEQIGIPRAARTTCVKPEGTASTLLGTGSGIHPHHARRYFRRVQANRQEPVFQHFKATNPHMVETSVYNPLTDDVITFPVEAPEGAILREDVGAIQFLQYVRTVQRHWVQAGRAHSKYNPGLQHNVSNTVTVKPEEWEAVRQFIWENREYFTGISLLQATGDKAYPQAPREGVTTVADIQRWNGLTYVPVDYSTLFEGEDNTALKDVVACAGGACELF